MPRCKSQRGIFFSPRAPRLQFRGKVCIFIFMKCALIISLLLLSTVYFSSCNRQLDYVCQCHGKGRDTLYYLWSVRTAGDTSAASRCDTLWLRNGEDSCSVKQQYHSVPM